MPAAIARITPRNLRICPSGDRRRGGLDHRHHPVAVGTGRVCRCCGAAKLEEFSPKVNPYYASQALAKVRSWSVKKRKNAQKNRRKLGARGVQIKSGAA